MDGYGYDYGVYIYIHMGVLNRTVVVCITSNIHPCTVVTMMVWASAIMLQHVCMYAVYM